MADLSSNPDKDGFSNLKLTGFTMVPVANRRGDPVTDMHFFPTFEYTDNTIDHQAGDIAIKANRPTGPHMHDGNSSQVLDLASMNHILEMNGEQPMELKPLAQYFSQMADKHGGDEAAAHEFDATDGGTRSLQVKMSPQRTDTMGMSFGPSLLPPDNDITESVLSHRQNGNLSPEQTQSIHQNDTNYDDNYAPKQKRMEGYIASASVVPTKDGKDVEIKMTSRIRRDVNPFHPLAGSVYNPNNDNSNSNPSMKISLQDFNKILALNGKNPLSREDAAKAYMTKPHKPLASSYDNLAFTVPFNANHNQVNADFSRLSGSKFGFDYKNIEKPLNDSAINRSKLETVLKKNNPEYFKSLTNNPNYVGSAYSTDLATHLPQRYVTGNQFMNSAERIFDKTHPVKDTWNGLKRFRNGMKARKARRHAFYHKFMQNPGRATGALIGHCIVGASRLIGKAGLGIYKGSQFIEHKAENHVNNVAIADDFANIDSDGHTSIDNRLHRYSQLTKRAVQQNDTKAMQRAEDFYRVARLDKACLQPNVSSAQRFQLLTQHYSNTADITKTPQDIQRAKTFIAQRNQLFGNDNSQDLLYGRYQPEQTKNQNVNENAQTRVGRYENSKPLQNQHMANVKSQNQTTQTKTKTINDLQADNSTKDSADNQGQDSSDSVDDIADKLADKFATNKKQADEAKSKSSSSKFNLGRQTRTDESFADIDESDESTIDSQASSDKVIDFENAKKQHAQSSQSANVNSAASLATDDTTQADNDSTNDAKQHSARKASHASAQSHSKFSKVLNQTTRQVKNLPPKRPNHKGPKNDGPTK